MRESGGRPDNRDRLAGREDSLNEAGGEKTRRAMRLIEQICIALSLLLMLVLVLTFIDRSDLLLKLEVAVGIGSMMNLLAAVVSSMKQRWVRSVILMIIGIMSLTALIFVLLQA